VNGSRKIRVIKRDGSEEPFDARKLGASMTRAMRGIGGGRYPADQLAEAIEIYVRRNGWRRVPSAAVFEMTVKALGCAELAEAGRAMEAHRAARQAGRRRLRVRHDDGQVTQWDKAWLGELARRSWYVSRSTGRLLAGQIEAELVSRGLAEIARQDVLEMLNRRVAEYGLADAVPVRAAAGS
jgi:hypothetical protein